MAPASSKHTNKDRTIARNGISLLKLAIGLKRPEKQDKNKNANKKSSAEQTLKTPTALPTRFPCLILETEPLKNGSCLRRNSRGVSKDRALRQAKPSTR